MFINWQIILRNKQIKETLVKDLFADYFSVYPSFIEVINETTVRHKGNQYHYSLETLEDGYYAQNRSVFQDIQF